MGGWLDESLAAHMSCVVACLCCFCNGAAYFSMCVAEWYAFFCSFYRQYIFSSSAIAVDCTTLPSTVYSLIKYIYFCLAVVFFSSLFHFASSHLPLIRRFHT